MTRSELVKAAKARLAESDSDKFANWVLEEVIDSVLPLITHAIAEMVEEQRRALTDDIPSYHGTVRNADDMSWVLAQARDRVVRWRPSDE